MAPPAAGLVRVFALVGLTGIRAGEWGDVPADRAEDWLDAGLVALVDHRGAPVPDAIPARRCCG